MGGTADVIARIVEQNLGVYEASESRLQEDVSQEAQVASDYRGRLVYELLQNADDAMAGLATSTDRVVLVVTDEELWIANSGRPLTEEDVQGLCGLGASSKVDASGNRRASIGHKGLGFKSVLDITDDPVVYSSTFSFRLGADCARPEIVGLWQRLERSPIPDRVPAMRFPAEVDDEPEQWAQFAADGLTTAFRFPFRADVDAERRRTVADLLLGLPLTTVLFLKHLESIEVHIDQHARDESRTWTVTRERRGVSEWETVPGIQGSGAYRVSVDDSTGDGATFLVAHDADVAINGNRGGLTGPAWDGVEVTEVSVAALEPGSEEMPTEWRRVHVFLPTAEPCPYPILVNGAFATDLSRQQVRVSDERGDYNAHLVREAARVCAAELLPELLASGIEAVLTALDRDRPDPGVEPRLTTAELFHHELCARLADIPLLPTEGGASIALGSSVVPPPRIGESGAALRQVLAPDAGWHGRLFPTAEMCRGRWARVIVDHGARTLSLTASLKVLAHEVDPLRSRSVDDPSGAFEVDPVLAICEQIWMNGDEGEREEIEAEAKRQALFPTTVGPDRSLTRVAVGDGGAFLPPKSAQHHLSLSGLRFMDHNLCWGRLKQNERKSALGERMLIWGSLFGVDEFQFETVVRSTVTPALTLDPTPEALRRRATLRSVEALASIAQLASGSIKPDQPLRYQRLEDRELFRLSRLPLPCRPSNSHDDWVPAYRAYFGSDWIGEASVEHLLESLPSEVADGLNVRFLAPPETFLGHLATAPEIAEEADDDDPADDEPTDDEDGGALAGLDEGQQWISFLSWLGVSSALRLIHFNDVEDQGSGWVSTRDLRQPKGHHFQDLGTTWSDFATALRADLATRPDQADALPYAYKVHDLDLIEPLCEAARLDVTGGAATALLAHLSQHWSWYSRFTEAEIALVKKGKSPGARTKPPRALSHELVQCGPDLWLHRLRKRAICPTSHGPRRPDRTWLPSAELDRRFPARSLSSNALLPVITLPGDGTGTPAWTVARALTVRSEPTPASFTLEDARNLCEQLEQLYLGQTIDAHALREVIRPTYGQLFELLSGRSTDPDSRGQLSGSPLLAETQDGLRFLPSHKILFSRTPGFRERSGLAGAVPTFVVEAAPASVAPLTRLFATRALEDSLEWTPEVGEQALSSDLVDELRDEMRALVPFLLARIRVQRSDPQDAQVLADFAARIEPVAHLEVTCRFDEEEVSGGGPRRYFVRRGEGSSLLQAFVVWEDASPWPPRGDAASGLAMAMADALGINLVESFLAFLRSDDDTERHRLLTIAGASDHLEPDLPEGPRGADLPKPRKPTIEPPPTDVEGAPPAAAAPPVPLRRFDDLTLNGEPIVIYGEQPKGESAGSSSRDQTSMPPSDARSKRPPAGTDLNALDALGMQIAIAFEVGRLQANRHPSAELVDADHPSANDTVVVDVHTPGEIKDAEAANPVVAAVMTRLESQGVSRSYPGCDLITIVDGEVDRMIELKSSTVNARTQDMSWNEWKTARHSEMRSRFWLYLVGNLRADLGEHVMPFVRAIKDPFGTLAAEAQEHLQARRTVQLKVREFTQAEHLDLGITPTPASLKEPDDDP